MLFGCFISTTVIHGRRRERTWENELGRRRKVLQRVEH